MIDEISTRWPMIHDPAQFVLRYAPAIEAYLTALVRDADKVEEIRQDFLVRVLQKGIVPQTDLKGRFRHYLKAAVRNAAISHLRRKAPGQASPEALAQLPAAEEEPALEREWLERWRACVLDRVWEALDLHERKTPDNHACTVLRVYVDHHVTEDSESMARRVAERLKKPMRPEAFRKQVSRARPLFAKFLVQEVIQTIEDPSPERIEEELSELGLLNDVMPYLPEGWREQL
jgi:DNA-directed RNA polymerase specialized sigma24 family protein